MDHPRDTVRQRIRGLYGIVDASLTEDVVRTGLSFVAGGLRVLQLRCKGMPDDEVLRAARALVPPCRAAGCTFLVNDAPELAVAADADGVHVGQTDGSTADIRRVLGPHRILGRSSGADCDPVGAAEGADYVAFGPVFDTPRLSRHKPLVGLEALTQVRSRVVGVPLVAIGGITPHNIAAVRATGVDAWAVIGALHGPDLARALRELS